MEISKRPNIIWFFGDQHRAQAMRNAGDANVNTPNMDALVAGGVNFRRAVSGCPWCSPFRGSLLTGLYPQDCVQQTPQRIDPSLPTVAHAFENAGYETAWFGKWHLAWEREPLPEIDGQPRHDAYPVAKEFRGGFRTWIGYNSTRSSFDTFVQGHSADGEEIGLTRLDGFETDALTDLLVDFIRKRGSGEPEASNEPFFAVCSPKPPHDPYSAPDEWMRRCRLEDVELRPNVPDIPWIQENARKDLAGYYALVENLDHNLGRVMTALDDSGLMDNTYIVFFSDHGDMHWSHGYKGKSVPWEESIRIPFVIGGGTIAPHIAGRHSDALLNTVDIMPTTLGLCGLDIPSVPGFDYSEIATADEVAGPLPHQPDSAFLQHLVPKLHNHTMNCTWRGIVTNDGWKYFCTGGTPLGMYELNDDPFEQHNLAFKELHKEKRTKLRSRLKRWIVETGDRYEV